MLNEMDDITQAGLRKVQIGDGERLDALLSAAVDAIVMIDQAGTIQTFSAAAERMFGYAASEVLGHNVKILMPVPYRNQHDDFIANYLRTGQAKIIGRGREIEACRKDGTLFPAELSVGEFRSGTRIGFVGIIRDISSVKRREDTLRSLGEIIEQSVNEIYVFDIDTLRFKRVNRGARQNLGYSNEELQQLTPIDLKPEFTRKRFIELLQPLKNGTAERVAFSTVHKRKDGTLYPVDVFIHRGSYDGSPCFVAIILDSTERQRIERQERQHQEELAHVARLSTLGEMAAGIAHEINQPLTAITTYTEACQRFLQTGNMDTGELITIMRKVSEQGHRAGEVIRKLRALAKKGASKREIADPNALVREVLTLAEVDARDHGISIELDLASDVSPVMVDAVQIHQVLLNLIRNSLDAMDGYKSEEPGIRISTAENVGEIEIAVADRGEGISQEALNNLFNPFFTTKKNGMGMGLSISRSLVNAHGGKLRYSANPSGGSIFSFTLPVASEE